VVALSLFTGAGGFDLGAHSAGIEVVRGVELDPHAQATASATGLPCILADVGDVAAVVADLPPISLVFGGPPCQPFSRAGAQRGGEDARDGFPATLAILRTLRPAWAVLENVGGFLDACFDDYRHKLLSDLRELFPAVVVWRLDAADYGVPQHRRRCFIVCGPRALRAPTPTHAEHADLFGQVKPWRSWGEALGMRGELDSSQTTPGAGGARVPCRPIPPHEPSPTVRAQQGTGLVLRPELLDRPAPTVSTAEVKGTRASAKSGWSFHGGPDRASDALFLATGRRLTIAECAALQAFPDGHPFQGPSEARYRQIGNAVPPPLAAAVLGVVVRG
jgi:DNA (cytosine-5)-methyltransferase 1